MSNPLITQIQDVYAAFRRGDVQYILSQLTDDISWEFEAPAVISWGGIRRGKEEAAGFFAGIAAEHMDPVLKMTEFFASADTVAAFGRYDATLRSTQVRVSVPAAHYFQFRQGKICRYVNFTNTAAFVEAASQG